MGRRSANSQTVINQKRTNKNVGRGENVIIFIIARQGEHSGFSRFSFLPRDDISAHEYGMYRDTCLLPYESKIATPWRHYGLVLGVCYILN